MATTDFTDVTTQPGATPPAAALAGNELIRILIVEDNPINVKVLMSSLEEYHYKLLVAQTGARAINIAIKTQPELILLDINLPEMNGFEVCKAIKSNRTTRHIPIIFLSALDDVESKVKGLSMGAVDYITKPFYKEEVIKRVETQLELHRMANTLREQKRELEDRNTKLQMVNDILSQVQDNIKHSFQKISDSIEYAQRIQHALLPDPANIKRHLPESFIFYRAKAIVSGDLYWFTHTKGKIILAAIDCTGHGVPGAFMSVIGHTQLNSIVIELGILDPGEILNQLDKRIYNIVNKHKVAQEANSPLDGMDISLVVIDPEEHVLRFAGANMNLIRVHNTNGSAELEEIKGEKLSIGGSAGSTTPGSSQIEKQFMTHTVPMLPTNWFYLYTDGYGDQFGGPEGKKFTRSKLRNLILEKSDTPAKLQSISLERHFDDWRGGTEQVDDVTVIGFMPVAG